MTITLYPGAPAYPVVYLDCVIDGTYGGTYLRFTGRPEGKHRLVNIVATVGYIIEHALVN